MDNKQAFIYLNNLQKSGVTNMFGAGEYLVAEFEIDKAEARQLLSYWMEHYEELKDLKAEEIKQEEIKVSSPTVEELQARISKLESILKKIISLGQEADYPAEIWMAQRLAQEAFNKE